MPYIPKCSYIWSFQISLFKMCTTTQIFCSINWYLLISLLFLWLFTWLRLTPTRLAYDPFASSRLPICMYAHMLICLYDHLLEADSKTATMSEVPSTHTRRIVHRKLQRGSNRSLRRAWRSLPGSQGWIHVNILAESVAACIWAEWYCVYMYVFCFEKGFADNKCDS